MTKKKSKSNVGFKSAKQKSFFQKVSANSFGRFQKISDHHDHSSYTRNTEFDVKTIILDHSYNQPVNSNHDRRTNKVDLVEDIELAEEVVEFDCSWREGRRVVELGVLADALAGCRQCNLPLQLKDCMRSNGFGLGTSLKIPCKFCNFLNSVNTGKKQGQSWDVNKKLVAGMINCGLGERQVNGLLAELNVPPVSFNTIKKNQDKVGTSIEMVAKTCVEEALKEEVEISKMNGSTSGCTICVDCGWQKRGSGRSYDSLSGHVAAIGEETGKCIGFALRCKTCRTCESATKRSVEPKAHSCRKNFDKSAKSMEADMVEEIVQGMINKGVDVEAIVGDEDSSTIAKVRKNVNENIKKKSDSNHVKKIISNALYSLKKHHKSLSYTVIKCVLNNFNVMLKKSKGNPSAVERGLVAMYMHPFGDHTSCDEEWCRHITNPQAVYKYLPYGKPLKDDPLQSSLKFLFHSYMRHSPQLSCLGSTQGNESFNKMVSDKAPKTRHFSASGSLSYRVAATVAQKNIGHNYIVEVNKTAGISPGQYTRRVMTVRDLQRRRQKAIATTIKAKIQRSRLKKERATKSELNETKEGATYETGIELKETEESTCDVSSIPPALFKPLPDKLDMNTDEFTEIIFDLETTGLDRTSHIIQLSAKREEDTFNCYIRPSVKIGKKAAEVTQITYVNDQMFYRGAPVDSYSITEALQMFIVYLQKSNKNVLIGHNVQSFDCRVLANALQSTHLLEQFNENVDGFIDSLKLYRQIFKEGSHKQESLAVRVLGEDFSYEAHNAVADVSVLQQMLKLCPGSSQERFRSSFSMQYILNLQAYKERIVCNLPSLQKLVCSKVLSKSCAQLIAGSGLSFCHILFAYKRNGVDGIRSIFGETNENKQVRVTNCKRISQAVADYLSTSVTS